MEEKNNVVSMVASIVSAIAIPLIAITYVTGFLVVSTFLDRFGLRDSGTEFLKVKYINTGIMFLIFPVILVAPVYLFAYLQRLRRKSGAVSPGVVVHDARDLQLATGTPPVSHGSVMQPSAASVGEAPPPVYLPSILLTMNLLVVFCVLALFAPFGYGSRPNKASMLLTLFATTIGGLVATQYVTEKIVRPEHAERVALVLRWLLLVLCVVLSIVLLDELAPLLLQVLWPGAFYFLGLMAMIGWILWRTAARAESTVYRDTRAKRTLWALALCLAGTLYYLSVLSFALVIFPYIPAAKGGGDMQESPIIVVRMYTKYKDSIPPLLYDAAPGDTLRLKPMKLFEERTGSVFLADPGQAGGPAEWRKPNGHKPQIIEVHREAIASIVYGN